MALTQTQQDWLEEDNLRIILVEASYNSETTPILCSNANGGSVLPDIYCSTTSINCNTTAIATAFGVVYLSNTPYITANGVTFDNVLDEVVQDISYDDTLETIPNITSKIDATSTIGSLTFYNTEGEYDELFFYEPDNAWEGHPIKILMGSPSWARSDFIVVFEGLIDAVTAPSTTTVSIAIRDKKDILTKSNESIIITTEYINTVLANATQFSANVESVPIVGDPLASIAYDPTKAAIPPSVLNTRVPICIGKCYNVEPVLIDSYNHIYLIHDGPIESILEADSKRQVKSSGLVLNEVVPVLEGDPAVQFEVDEAIGCIRLLDHPRSSKITVDVDGAELRGSGYDTDPANELTRNTVPWVMEWLALEKSPMIATDLDYDTFTAITNTAEVGIFFKGEEQVADLMTQVINSIGGYYRFDRASKLQLKVLLAPVAGAHADITQDYIVQNGISLSTVEVPREQITISYRKNWTVLTKEEYAGILEYVVGGLELQQDLSSEYRTLTKVIPGVKVQYPLAETYDTIETLFYNEADAQIELDRRVVIRVDKRFIYKIESIIPPLNLSVGDSINVTYDRFGFDSPKPAIVLGLSEKITNNRVDIEAWL